MAKAPSIPRTPTYAADRRIGQAVAAEIAYSGVSRSSVADAIGLDKASLSRSIGGQRQWKATELLGIAATLDIPVSYLLEPQRPGDTPTQPGSQSACNGDNVIDLWPRVQVAA